LDKVMQQRREAVLNAIDDAGRQEIAQAEATSRYWLAELAVPDRASVAYIA
jgi:hypothetical protein